MTQPRLSPASRARRAVVLLLTLCGLVLGSGMAAADAPFRIPSQITDRNSSVGCDNSAVNAALANLRSKDSVQLWVVLTDNFSGLDGKTWAKQATQKSGFGSNMALLAIATTDRAYGYYASDGFPLSLAQRTAIAQQSVEPKLSSSDWAGAVVAAANGYESAISDNGSNASGSVSCTAEKARSGGVFHKSEPFQNRDFR